MIVDSRATKTVVTEATVTLSAQELKFLTGVLMRYSHAKYSFTASHHMPRKPRNVRQAAALAETFAALSR